MQNKILFNRQGSTYYWDKYTYTISTLSTTYNIKDLSLEDLKKYLLKNRDTRMIRHHPGTTFDFKVGASNNNWYLARYRQLYLHGYEPQPYAFEGKTLYYSTRCYYYDDGGDLDNLYFVNPSTITFSTDRTTAEQELANLKQQLGFQIFFSETIASYEESTETNSIFTLYDFAEEGQPTDFERVEITPLDKNYEECIEGYSWFNDETLWVEGYWFANVMDVIFSRPWLPSYDIHGVSYSETASVGQATLDYYFDGQNQRLLNKFYSLRNPRRNTYTIDTENNKIIFDIDWTYVQEYSLENPIHTEVSSQSSTTYPSDGQSDDSWYISQSGHEEDYIDDTVIVGGVDYEKTINTTTNYQPGTVACARIMFTTRDKSTLHIGDEIIWQCKQLNDTDFRQLGIFIITNIEKIDDKYKIVALDRIEKFNTVVDEFLATFNFEPSIYGYKLEDFTEAFCNYMNLEYVGYDGKLPGETGYRLVRCYQYGLRIYGNPFVGQNINGKDVLQHLAEAFNSYVEITAEGKIHFGSVTHSVYDNTAIEIDNSKYTKITLSEYLTCMGTDNVWAGMSNDDVGTWAGTPTAGETLDNVLRITGNLPFMIISGASSSSVWTLQYALSQICNDMGNYTESGQSVILDNLTPMSLSLLCDYGIECGDYIKVTKDNGAYFGVVYTKKITASGVELEFTGDSTRAQIKSFGSDIKSLTGKYNKLSLTVDETVNTVGDLSTDMETTVRIRSDGVTIEDAEHNKVTITGTCVNAQDLELSGRITFTDLNNDTQTRINNGGHIYRQATPPTDTTIGAMWYCTQDYGTEYKQGVWYTWNGTIWKTADVQLPTYIKETYIDSTTILSPHIEGNNIEVNGDLGGAFNVKKNGLSVGYMGIGSSYDTQHTLREGIVVANNDDGRGTQLDNGDNYLSITPNEVRLSYGTRTGTTVTYKSIIIDSDGLWYEDDQRTRFPLDGIARFG